MPACTLGGKGYNLPLNVVSEEAGHRNFSHLNLI